MESGIGYMTVIAVATTTTTTTTEGGREYAVGTFDINYHCTDTYRIAQYSMKTLHASSVIASRMYPSRPKKKKRGRVCTLLLHCKAQLAWISCGIQKPHTHMQNTHTHQMNVIYCRRADIVVRLLSSAENTERIMSIMARKEMQEDWRRRRRRICIN